MLMVLGASHHDLELTELERLAAGSDVLERELSAKVADDDSAVAGYVVLATCNRVEIYVEAERFHDAIEAVTDAVAAATGADAGSIGSSLNVRVGAPVAAHLFAVASGLDSMVVGEAEISGQVGAALRRAQAGHSVTPSLNSLFQSAARTSKLVAAGTPLGDAGRSVASVALAVAVAGRPAGLTRSRVLIIGTGAYARVVAAALRLRGAGELLVHSPSGRAAAFAATHDATAVTTADLPQVLADIDLVVSCSGTTGGVLDAAVVAAALAGREEPLPIIDLALRPDVPEAVRQLPEVRVIDLNTVALRADPAHAGAIIAAQDIVIAAVAKFEDQAVVRTLDPAVVALRTHVAAAVERELLRLREKYDDSVADDLTQALHRVTQSLLHTPTMRAQELARSGDGEDYVKALHTLFGIEIPSPH